MKECFKWCFKNIYSVLETTPSWFMIIDATEHMQWSATMRVKIDAFPISLEVLISYLLPIFPKQATFFSPFKILVLMWKWNNI